MMFTRITVTEEKQYMRQCLRRNRKKRVGRKKHGFREGRGRTEKNGVRIWGERHEAGAAGQRMTRKPDKVGSWEKGGGSQSEGKREEKRLTARVEEISLLSVCQFDRRKTENSWGLSLHACVCPCVLLPTAKTGCPVFGICEFTPEREREMGGTARTARDQRHTHTCVHTHTHAQGAACVGSDWSACRTVGCDLDTCRDNRFREVTLTHIPPADAQSQQFSHS